MIYKFSSKAAGDILMTDDVAARLLRVMGKDVLPQALHALAAAVAQDESRLAQIKGEPDSGDSEYTDVESVTLRQHVWPFADMLKQAQAAGEVIVWGV